MDFNAEFVERFNQIEASFDESFSRINFDMIEAIALYEEASLDDYLDSYITEKKKENKLKDPLSVRLKKFLMDIITTIQNFILTTKTEVENKIREKNTAQNLRELHKKLEQEKNRGKATVTVTDVWKMKEIYLSGINEMKKIILRISKNEYNTLQAMDEDIDRFEEIALRTEKELEKANERKVEVPTDKMLAFVEYEITGKSSIMKSLNDAISMFNQMRADVTAMENKRDALGPDALSKYASSVRRASFRFGNILKKWAVKFIVKVCLIFG